MTDHTTFIQQGKDSALFPSLVFIPISQSRYSFSAKVWVANNALMCYLSRILFRFIGSLHLPGSVSCCHNYAVLQTTSKPWSLKQFVFINLRDLQVGDLGWGVFLVSAECAHLSEGHLACWLKAHFWGSAGSQMVANAAFLTTFLPWFQ